MSTPCYHRAMQGMTIFHTLLIPFIGGLALTVAKVITDQKVLSFDESNDIALDMVLLGVGALGAFSLQGGPIQATIDAAVGDAFLATILLYVRYQRKRQSLATSGNLPEVGALRGTAQLILGLSAILWTMYAF